MSYLLTEIAMEMLGWQFYDTDGIARPINLEGLNIAKTAGAEPLKKALGIQFLDQRDSVKAEADSSSIDATQLYEEQDMQENTPLDLFENELTTASKVISNVDDLNANELMHESNSSWNINTNNEQREPLIINNVTNNTMSLKIQSVVGGVDLTSDGKPVFPTKVPSNNTHPEMLQTSSSYESNFQMPSNNVPVPIAIHANPICNEINFQTSSNNTYEQAIPETVVTLNTPCNNTDNSDKKSYQKSNYKTKPKTLQSSAKTSKWNTISVTKTPITQPVHKLNKLQTENFTDFELQQMLESELFKVALDVSREKSRFYKSLEIDPASKANMPVLRKAMETYSAQEFDNLKKEFQNLYELRQKAEHLCVTKFPKSYERYASFSNALCNSDLLDNTFLTIPINSNTIKTKQIISNVTKNSLK